ncbi:MAG: 5-formyltetrahydrofolate cyclo-ligase, partial [Mesorhizobium sp.]
MASDHDADGPGQYSSPPCFMHELDPEFRAPLADW